MTSAISTPERAAAPDTPQRRALGARLVIIAAAAVCAATGVTTFVTAPLFFLAFLLLFESVVKKSSRGALDAVILTVGGLLVGAVLVGLLLDVVPGGIDRTSWAVAAGLSEGAIVTWARPGRIRIPFRPIDLSPYLAGVALIAMGLVLATVAQHQAGQAPVALSITPAQAGAPTNVAVLRVTSTSPTGPLTLVEKIGTRTVDLATGFTVDTHHPMTENVTVDSGQRVTIRLLSGSGPSGAELRSITLDRP